jgi:hypothetical protein
MAIAALAKSAGETSRYSRDTRKCSTHAFRRVVQRLHHSKATSSSTEKLWLWIREENPLFNSNKTVFRNLFRYIVTYLMYLTKMANWL